MIGLNDVGKSVGNSVGSSVGIWVEGADEVDCKEVGFDDVGA